MNTEKNVSAPSGLEMIEAEMQRQHDDALRSLDGNAMPAFDIAASVRRNGRLVMLGMGGSHCVNRSAEAIYRQAGIDCQAISASEFLYTPLPTSVSRTTLLTSQSGESAEIVRYLDAHGVADTFGLTMEPESRLGASVSCLSGQGGSEKAFAATRSLLITLALHAAVAEALGQSQDEARAALSAPPDVSIDAGLSTLSGVDAIFFSGRKALTGIAEAGALGLLELARIPGLALEGGQLRHGPLEAVSSKVGVVLLRADDETAPLVARLAGDCVAAGAHPVIFDASGAQDIPGCSMIKLPRSNGLAAAFHVLPPLQRLLIEIAKNHVARVGEPVRSQKVTRTE